MFEEYIEEFKKRIEWTKKQCGNAPYIPFPTEMAYSLLAKMEAKDNMKKNEETDEERIARKRKEFEEDDCS